MGIDYSTLQFLINARTSGVSFEEVVTLGRQDVLIRSELLVRLMGRLGTELSQGEMERMLTASAHFAEPLFDMLGGKTIDSIDCSAFEGATIVHDMNQAVPQSLKGRYSLVFDGGTLEHVFNFPTAIGNCMEMVRPGGHFLAVTPADNMMGHGFYQFSPELFFRVFSQENGYAVRKLLVSSSFSTESQLWYEVQDPKVIGQRVELRSIRPTSIFLLAERTAVKPLFTLPPQQSDYVAEWDTRSAKAHDDNRLAFFRSVETRRSAFAALRPFVPSSLKRLWRTWRLARRLLKPPDPRFFVPTRLE